MLEKFPCHLSTLCVEKISVIILLFRERINCTDTEREREREREGVALLVADAKRDKQNALK